MICGIWAPSPCDGGWCLICDQGKYDAVILQSDNRRLLELNQPIIQTLHDKPLTIVPFVEVRKVEWSIEEFFSPIGST